MKKIVTILSAALIAAIFTGCASTKAEEQKSKKEPTKLQTTDSSKADTVSSILIDDFEYGVYWEAVGSSWNDGDCSMFCKASSDWGTEGETSLECTVTTKGAEWEKSGFFTSPLDTDWTGLSKITMDVYNPNDFDISICPVLQAGENWESWNQFEAQIVPPGEASLTFDISAGTNLNFIQRVIIYQFGAVPQQCKFYIDNVQAK